MSGLLSSELFTVNQHFSLIVAVIEFRFYRSKDRGHGQITMMPIGVPRVPYRNVREGTWQWLDLYNALVS